MPSTASFEADKLAVGRAAHMRMLEATSHAELAALGASARRVQRS